MNTEITSNQAVASVSSEHELAEVAKDWWFFLLTGAFLIIAGVIAIAYPWIASVSFVMVLGILLIVSGLVTIVTAFWAGRWGAFMMQILIGICILSAGSLSPMRPLNRSPCSLFLWQGSLSLPVAFVSSRR